MHLFSLFYEHKWGYFNKSETSFNRLQVYSVLKETHSGYGDIHFSCKYHIAQIL